MQTVAQAKWILFLRGIISIFFGAIVFLHPALTLQVLVLFFSVYVIIMGLSTIIYSISERKSRDDWWILLLEGCVGVVVGCLVWVWPALSAVMLLYVIAVWAIITGIMQLFTAIKYRQFIQHDFWLGLSGIVSVLFGSYIILYPGAGAIALAWLIGAYAVLFGVLLICMGGVLGKADPQ